LGLELVGNASPGLKAGRGLKQRQAPDRAGLRHASPGLKAGRGLKPRPGRVFGRPEPGASPGLKAGRGLKPGHAFRDFDRHAQRIARPQGRARIETPTGTLLLEFIDVASPGLKAGRGLKLCDSLAVLASMACIARPQGRARIETRAGRAATAHPGASPGLKAGRGLKHRLA